MSLREAAFRMVDTKRDELERELPGMQQAILRKAAATTMSGNVVVQLVDEYGSRMNQLVAVCVERYAWEISHAVLPSRLRYPSWQRKAFGTLAAFKEECQAQYAQATKNIAVLNSPGVSEEAGRLIRERHNAAVQSVFAQLGTQQAESEAETLKSSLTFFQKYLVPVITAAIGALVARLWHQLTG